jgi:hypothetical protein
MNKASIALACALAGMPAATALDAGQIHAAKHATERFQDVREAKEAGYRRAGDCVPGMGFHYERADLAGDRKLRVRKPEILVYERRDGRMRLVALEYFRADEDQDMSTDDDRPRLFERGFDGPMEGHSPGMPIHFDLHAWLYKRNPSGRFEAFNPRVEC